MNAFDHEKRGSMTPQRRARVFARRDGKCHKCTRKLGPSDFWIVEPHVDGGRCALRAAAASRG